MLDGRNAIRLVFDWLQGSLRLDLDSYSTFHFTWPEKLRKRVVLVDLLANELSSKLLQKGMFVPKVKEFVKQLSPYV